VPPTEAARPQPNPRIDLIAARAKISSVAPRGKTAAQEDQNTAYRNGRAAQALTGEPPSQPDPPNASPRKSGRRTPFNFD